MSAPDLPDIFGNYALGKDFAEVVAPESISWLPQATGWVILLALLSLWCMRWLWLRLRRWYRDRYRREALAKLQALATAERDGLWLSQLNKLMKLAALAGYSRERVAKLSGEQWIRFLNNECPSPPFSQQHAHMLTELSYQNVTPSQPEQASLINACSVWLNTHAGSSNA